MSEGRRHTKVQVELCNVSAVATQQQFNIFARSDNLMCTRGDDVETEELMELNADSERVAMASTADKWLAATQFAQGSSQQTDDQHPTQKMKFRAHHKTDSIRHSRALHGRKSSIK